jgi:hypothetical protein
MSMTDVPRQTPFLGPDAPVPIDRPFTSAEARAAGASRRQLATWVADGLLITPIRGVAYAAQLADGLELRAACLRLVVPDDAVVTDRTAGWFHGASMVLAPNDHLAVPPVSMYRSITGYRLRNDLTQSGERTFLPGEVVQIDGLRVTSKLRTACDLGLLLPREQGFAGMDAMAAISDFDASDLVRLGDSRFKGYRGVRTFRGTAPYVDGLAQSPPESLMKLRWRDCQELPPPVPQAPAKGPDGWFYLDLGVPDLRYAAEYDGPVWHGPERQEHDRARRSWLVEHEGWIIDVFTASDLWGPGAHFESRLRAGIVAARRRFGGLTWSGLDRGPC